MRSAKAEEARVKAEAWVKSLPSLLASDEAGLPSVSVSGFLSYDHHHRSFDNLGSARFSGQTALRVKVENGGGGALYLKGYTGGLYTSGGWELAGDEAYAALAEACAPVDPQNLTAYRYKEWGIQATVTVRNQANKKSVYVPSWLITTPDQFALAEYVGDGNIRARGLLGLDEYTVKYLDQTSNLSNVLAKDNIYLDLPGVEQFEQYTQAVYQYYTEVPENLAPTLTKLLNEAGLGLGPIQGQAAAFGVSHLLERQASYTLTPGAAPEGVDFTEYFLLENHKGFCVHFATAGVLLMRSLGIPARYCEGYLVTPTDLRLKGSDGFSNVPDRRAHAWVEYYQAGVGWITMECTPGFNPQSDVVQPNDVSNETEATPVPTEKPETAPTPVPVPTPTPEITGQLRDLDLSKVRAIAILKVAVWPMLAALVVLVFVVRRKITLKLRGKAFAQEDANLAALAVYAASDQLTPYVGEMAREMTDLAEKARFSQHELNGEELGALKDDWRGRKKAALAGAKLWKRLWLIWGLCLEEQ